MAEQAPAAPSPLAGEPEHEGGAPASEALPWQASFLMDYVTRCLEALTALYPQCAPIQARTRAADMAVALFRCCAPRRGLGGGGFAPMRAACGAARRGRPPPSGPPAMRAGRAPCLAGTLRA